MAEENDGLNRKQRRFVDEYMVDMNGTAAAIRAGYSARSAKEQAAALLTKPNILAYLREKQGALASRNAWTQDRIVAQLAPIAESDIGDILDFGGDSLYLRKPSDIPEAARRAIASVKVKTSMEGKGEDAVPVQIIEFKFWDKQTATDQLTRHFGWYKKPGEGDDGSETVSVNIQVLRHVENILRLVMGRVRAEEYAPLPAPAIDVTPGNGHGGNGNGAG